MTAVPDRGRADLCPGIAKPFSADDGAIVRLRAPGGRTAMDVLRRLASLGPTGFVQLTSRGNLQVRALPDPLPAEVVDAVIATGLVPSAAHERMRNIVCSPLTGLSGGLADLRPVVAELDRALLADPVLAALPGRMLCALDDGRGDVVTEPFDLAVVATSATHGEVRQGGRDIGVRVALTDAPAVVVELARAFQAARVRLDPIPWHVRELPDPLPGEALDPVRPGDQPRPGAVGDHLVVGVPLGMLTLAQTEALAAVTDEVVVTPWRSVVVPDGAKALGALHAVGLTTEPDDAWAAVSACTGAPGCRRTTIETLPMAREVVALLGATPARRIHLSGCDRRCGMPRRSHHEFVAPASAADVVAAVRESGA